MDIQVGEYVRTAEGLIRKVDQIGNYTFWLEDNTSIALDDINIKHSFNIIDLIEVGDYVNGIKIADSFKIETTPVTKNKIIVFNHDIDRENSIFDFQIKTIVTKEQFKAVEYEV